MKTIQKIDTLEILCRPYVEQDIKYIVSSLRKDLKATPTFKHYYPKFDDSWEGIKLFLLNQRAIVGCSPEDPDLILSYLIYTPLHDRILVHWTHVKKSYRLNNVATAMLKYIGIRRELRFTLLPRDIIRSNTFNLKYTPIQELF